MVCKIERGRRQRAAHGQREDGAGGGDSRQPGKRIGQPFMKRRDVLRLGICDIRQRDSSREQMVSLKT